MQMVGRVTEAFPEYLRDLADYCETLEEIELVDALCEAAQIIESDTAQLFSLQFQQIINSEMIRELTIEKNQWKVRALQAEKKTRRKKGD